MAEGDEILMIDVGYGDYEIGYVGDIIVHACKVRGIGGIVINAV